MNMPEANEKPSSALRAPLVLAVCLILAIASGWHALVMATRSQRPAVALALDSNEPLALVRSVGVALAAAVEKGERPGFIAPIARESLIGMALNPNALRYLAISGGETVESDVDFDLVKLSDATSRRDLGTQALLIKLGGAEGDIRLILNAYDAALRTNEESWPLFFPRLAEALELPEARGEVATLIDQKPVWRSDFLIATVGATQNPEIYYEILVEGRRMRQIARHEEIERSLVGRLVVADRFDLARNTYLAIQGKDETALTSPALTASNTAANSNALDWMFFEESAFGAQPYAGNLMSVYADAGRGGRVAQKILYLKPGSYILSAQVADTSSRKGGGLSWRGFCLRNGLARTSLDTPRDMTGGSGTETSRQWQFSVPAECQAIALDLLVQGGNEREPTEFLIENLALRKTGA